jgi:hypothetical protein
MVIHSEIARLAAAAHVDDLYREAERAGRDRSAREDRRARRDRAGQPRARWMGYRSLVSLPKPEAEERA